jgi:hypothetical protein
VPDDPGKDQGFVYADGSITVRFRKAGLFEPVASLKRTPSVPATILSPPSSALVVV